LAEFNEDGDLIDPETGEPVEVTQAGASTLRSLASRLAARLLNRLPTKVGGGGKLQPFDPATGRFAKPAPLFDSPAVRFGVGAGEGLGVTLYNAGELPPAVGARRAGQVTGQVLGSIINQIIGGPPR
jgi:hypothetical protein